MNRSREKKRIKILFITRWYPNKTNIQLAVFIQKHAAAVSQYCEVALLNTVPVDKQKNIFEITHSIEYGFTEVIIYYKTVNFILSPLNKLFNFLRFLKAHRTGMKIIREKFGDHDITHAYIFIRPAVIAWWMKIFRGKPFVISEQWSGYVTGKFEKRNFAEQAMTRFVARKAAAFTAVSEFLKKGMIKNGIKGNYYVIPNIIETDSKPTIEISKGSTIRILTVADLADEIKNISGTIKAIAEIVKEYPQVRFDIVGGGHDRKKLEQIAGELSLLNKHVFFHGMKTNAEVYQHLHQCDFLVMNSRFETFSSICAEAMSCGKPVIATRCGGPDEFVIPQTGILIQPDNHEELVTAIRSMIKNFRTYDAPQIKKYVAEKFNASVIGQQFLDVYKSILS